LRQLHRILVLLAVLAATAAGPPVARAGTYDVVFDCSRGGEENRSWVFETNAPSEFEQATTCPAGHTTTSPLWGLSDSGAFSGLLATSHG
jgi:hypothetical protein